MTEIQSMRKEYRLRAFRNRMLRRICRPKRDEVKEDWRKLHSEKALWFILVTQYYLGNQINKIKEMGEACGMYGREKETYMVLVGKRDESRPLGRGMHRREVNNTMDFKDISWEDVE